MAPQIQVATFANIPTHAALPPGHGHSGGKQASKERGSSSLPASIPLLTSPNHETVPVSLLFLNRLNHDTCRCWLQLSLTLTVMQTQTRTFSLHAKRTVMEHRRKRVRDARLQPGTSGCSERNAGARLGKLNVKRAMLLPSRLNRYAAMWVSSQNSSGRSRSTNTSSIESSSLSTNTSSISESSSFAAGPAGTG